jgi:MFS family permease
MALYGTLFVLGPAVAEQDLGGADSWGLVVGAFGLGSVLGGIVALRVPARRQLRSIFSVALITVPAVLLLAVPAPIAVLATAFMASGIAMSYASTVYEVVLQQWIPAAILARIASYDWLVTTVLSSLGLVLAGWFGDQIGVPETLIASGAVVTAAAAIALVSPVVRRADVAHARPAPEPGPMLVPEALLVLPDPPQPGDVVVTLPDPPSVWARPD